MATTPAPKHKWQFPARFRTGVYRWNGTAKASKNLKAAVLEIQKVAKKDPQLGAEGATRLLEKLVPSIEGIDGSSGAIGTAVNHAVEKLALVISAGAETAKHEQRVERVFTALQDDGYGYLDGLGDEFARICGSKTLAKKWGLELLGITKTSFLHGGYFSGTSACLSCLLEAECYQELESVLDIHVNKFWPYEKYRIMAWAQTGQLDQAIQRTEAMVGDGAYGEALEYLEDLLISSGRWEEAFQKYGPRMRSNTYLASFKATSKKYPMLSPEEIFRAYLLRWKGDEGKWFATARSLGLYDLALDLARMGPCNPETIKNGAAALAQKKPEIAFQLALAAVDAYLKGWAYEYTVYDILSADTLAKDLALTESQKEARSSFLAERKTIYGTKFPRLFERVFVVTG